MKANKRDDRKSKTTHLTQKDYDAESFDALFRRDGGRETTDDITDFRYILSPIDGMPPLWPRPHKWPFDPELKKRYAKRLSLPLFLVFSDQRVADYAHRHFNYLADLHAKDSAVKPACEWATIICGPSCWDPCHLGIDLTPCTAAEFKSRMMREVFNESGFQFSANMNLRKPPSPPFVRGMLVKYLACKFYANLSPALLNH
jgi:hypothetical protein